MNIFIYKNKIDKNYSEALVVILHPTLLYYDVYNDQIEKANTYYFYNKNKNLFFKTQKIPL